MKKTIFHHPLPLNPNEKLASGIRPLKMIKVFERLEYAGFIYDSTGSYADMLGFRYGVCYEFSMFDFLQRQKLKLRQRPLIAMECSVIDERYMGLGYSDEALKIMQDLKEKCYRYNGNFSLLWHNSHLKSTEDKKFFMEMLN